MPGSSRTIHAEGSDRRSMRTQKYSDRLTLFSASTLWASQNSYGPKKFQLGPRRNVPSTISVHPQHQKPNRKR